MPRRNHAAADRPPIADPLSGRRRLDTVIVPVPGDEAPDALVDIGQVRFVIVVVEDRDRPACKDVAGEFEQRCPNSDDLGHGAGFGYEGSWL